MIRRHASLLESLHRSREEALEAARLVPVAEEQSA